MPRRYSYPVVGDGTVWLQCAMCERSFRAWRYQQREGMKFCSIGCFQQAQRAFTKALADGRLNGLLAEERARAKALAAQQHADAHLCYTCGGTETDSLRRQIKELGAPLTS